MIADFLYYNPVKIYFGRDQVKNLPFEIKRYNNYGNHSKNKFKVLLTYGGNSIKNNGIYREIRDLLADFSVVELNGIEPNPDVTSVRAGAEICKKENIDVILAVGGGSVIDASKWIAASACVEHDSWDFFEKRTSIDNALPLITVPTMAATGSEMNNGGVISNRERMKKIGRSSPYLFPKASFLNPEYTYSVNRYQTACGVADIMSHIIEVYFNNQESLEMLDSIMESLLKTAIKYGPIALEEPNNYQARANIMWAASWAINGFINGPVRQAWNCHTIEHELSARYGITHGHGLAVIMPKWLRYCYSKECRAVYERFARNVFGIDYKGFSIDKLCSEMEEFLYVRLGLEAKLRIPNEDLHAIAESLCTEKNISGFAELGKNDVYNILSQCCVI